MPLLHSGQHCLVGFCISKYGKHPKQQRQLQWATTNLVEK